MLRKSPSFDRNTATTPGHEQKPAIPSRNSLPEKKHRDRADTVDFLSSAPSVKLRSMTTIATPPRKHDYEEIDDDIGEYELRIL